MEVFRGVQGLLGTRRVERNYKLTHNQTINREEQTQASGLKGQNTNQCRNTYFLMYLSYSSFNFDIISINTAGIGGLNIASKRRKIFNYVKKHSSRNGRNNIMLLQETHNTEKVEAMWTNQWGCGKGAIHFPHDKSDSRGVLTAFRERLDYKIDPFFVIMTDDTLSFKQRFRTTHSFQLIIMHLTKKAHKYLCCPKLMKLLMKLFKT